MVDITFKLVKWKIKSLKVLGISKRLKAMHNNNIKEVQNKTYLITYNDCLERTHCVSAYNVRWVLHFSWFTK